MHLDKNAPIGILDSGVGGLTVLTEMNKQIPDRSVIYFGDTLRMPYGNRSAEEIAHGANEMIKFLQNKGACAILLACNTISSYMDMLESSVPLISIVTAGAEMLCGLAQNEPVGIIATVATKQSKAYENNIKSISPERKVVCGSSATLPKIIDSNIEDESLLAEKIAECVDPIIKSDGNIKNILLACSHFPIIKDRIEALYPGINFLDPASRQVEILKQLLSEDKPDVKRKVEIYTTADTYEFAAAIKRLGLEFDSLMKVKLFEND